MIKLHTTAETLSKPYALAMVKDCKKLQRISQSENAIQNTIDNSGADILNQVVTDIKTFSAKISVQLDEWIEFSNYSKLVVFAQYVKGNAIEKNSVLQTTQNNYNSKGYF